MSLKRKRQPEQSNILHALTEANLKELNNMNQTQVGTPSESVPSQGTNESGSEMGTTWSHKSSELLHLHRIFIDRRETMPSSVKTLCDKLRKIRSGSPTPRSKAVSSRWRHTKGMKEAEAMRMLENYLGYRGEIEDEGEHAPGENKICRGWNRKVRVETLPLASSVQINLQKWLEKLDVPSQPQPDITYGYPDTAFSDAELVALTHMPMDALALREQPWFPFWLVEWKGKDGLVRDAETQARRDGAAAANAMDRFYKATRQSQSLTPADICVFSATIDPNHIYIRCHWKNGAEADSSWEADIISHGALFEEIEMYQVRSTILNILTWARDERLPHIKEALLGAQTPMLIRTPSPKRRAKQITASPSISSVSTISQFNLPTPSGSSAADEPQKKKQKTSAENPVPTKD